MCQRAPGSRHSPRPPNKLPTFNDDTNVNGLDIACVHRSFHRPLMPMRTAQLSIQEDTKSCSLDIKRM
ncbi:MAG: hypothetical protein MI923_21190 [Phycisphaerales bacterium]|nr:hypothetical protein [Phycisphaerales bacterium]